MSFKITITRIEERKTLKNSPHTIIDERPWTAEEVNENVGMCETGEQFLKRNPIKHVYGYPPAFETTEKVETPVLEQVVAELDIVGVIKAINGIQ